MGFQILPVTDKKAAIPYEMLDPHYTDDRFRESRTIYLDPEFKIVEKFGTRIVDGVEYEYSDRLADFNGIDKCNEAMQAARQQGVPESTPEFYEKYLRILLDRPNLRLVHMLSGVNRGDGFSYRVYGFIG